MRDFKLKLKIIWCLLRDTYTSSTKHKVWWLWTSKDEHVMISFSEEKYHFDVDIQQKKSYSSKCK